MSAITPRWVDAFNRPTELALMVAPLSAHCCASSACVLLASVGIEKEQLVGSTDGPYVITVKGPVESCDETAVALKDRQFLISRAAVDVDVVVMRADG